MIRRTAGIAAAAVLTATLLAGCASGPTDEDRAGWDDWARQLTGANGMGVSGRMAVEVGDDDGVRMDLASPTATDAVELRCIGADRARFTLHYEGTGGEASATQDIVCHNGDPRTPIAIPTSVGSLSALTAVATSPDGEGVWVVLPQLSPR
ncbi:MULTISPECIES: hypothetical protein [unclassified Microbacterium]|uniref:hypothetical protein n=1 Tax=unclassified Microbacterium TaxID=2609290 RepID=UPI0030196169